MRTTLITPDATRSDSDIRITLVIQIKQQIKQGAYETTAKLEAAFERLLSQLGECG